ncbi:COX15/CtaA family protein [Streptosporangium sp. NBC_01495]|uniref:COX15/CtaA family protein n=1 Tax=Streptosporangium sp. NBC_01495 TaxID=2903899 RepID=UPI002E32F50C|nr:COX15/CtaA family protein [Streptosporangium sp. NBC_01495]
MNHLLDKARRHAVGSARIVGPPTLLTLRRWALAAVVVNVGITVTGAAVRVSGSGLGCPTWPRCTPESFTPVAHADISPLNMAIEFGNRMLTFLVLAVGVACLVAALRLPARRPDLVRLAWLQPIGVAFQGLWGGLVVRSALNPVTVSVHFLVSIGMIAAAYALYARAAEEGSGGWNEVSRQRVHRHVRTLVLALVAAVFVLLVVGVVVTGTGPHSGDEMASRFGFDIETVARIHADVAYVVVGLTFALAFALHITDAPGPARRAAWTLLGVEAAQGVIGYVQYFLGVPAALVNLHVLGATLVWVCALRVVFATGPRGPGDASEAVTGELDTVRV